jgi:hypothetical protein
MKDVFPVAAAVRDTGSVKGRGVFATKAFIAGELVEACPVIVLYQPFELLAPKIQKVVYNWGSLAKTGQCSALALGYGSLYNHSNPANMRYEADVENQTLNYYAVSDIAAGEELTVNYNNTNGQPESDNDVWFDSRGVELIVD